MLEYDKWRQDGFTYDEIMEKKLKITRKVVKWSIHSGSGRFPSDVVVRGK